MLVYKQTKIKNLLFRSIFKPKSTKRASKRMARFLRNIYKATIFNQCPTTLYATAAGIITMPMSPRSHSASSAATSCRVAIAHGNSGILNRA